ncbi:MAG: type II secretion system minor pseudopilin GspI [Steroidobacteraceae bacterium]
MRRRRSRGFTLVEVLVALMIVAIGLAALMTAVSGTARTSGYLRDKTLAQWIALNRLAEVRLTVNKIASTTGQNTDAGQLDFANRTWHFDTRYFDTSIPGMKRVVVRVWAGDAKTKGNPLAESASFLGSSLGTPGSSNVVDWTTGTTAIPCTPATGGTTATGTTTTSGTANAAGTTPCTPPGTATGIPTGATGTATGGSTAAGQTTPQ